MFPSLLRASCIAGLIGLSLPSLAVGKFSGSIEAELQVYPHRAKLEQQKDVFGSVAIRPEYYWRSENKQHKIKTLLFYRATEPNGERTHGDIRELTYLFQNKGFYFKAGIDTVFWGVTESAHLVDIINQTDNVESISGEEKLGQPMLAVGIENDFGNIDAYVLPYFRPIVFPDGPERYQIGFGGFSPELEKDENFYQSDDEEENIDLALRWFKSFDNFDLGISYFNGIDRSVLPVTLDLLAALGSQSINKIGGYYQNLEQLGLEYQYLYEDWIFKLEASHKLLDSGDFSAAVFGFEYTFSDMDPWGQDIGILLEYLWNDRDDVDLLPFTFEANPDIPADQYDAIRAALVDAGQNPVLAGDYFSPMQNDIFLGTRFALNDIAGTEFLAGLIYDLDDRTTSMSFEGSTRIGDSVRITANMYFFNQVYRDNPFKQFEDDDLFELKAEWFF
ncbi:MAG: hypothetical protein HRU21_03465 [Pseudomonadales bacterium]|nr:hypothetical protein [Pseudomonadales bacterium]